MEFHKCFNNLGFWGTCKHYFILIHYYVWGRVFSILFYKKKYYWGKHFCSIGADGWRWCCLDAFGKRYNPRVPWPVSAHNIVTYWPNVHFDPDDLNNFQGFGKYFQATPSGHITIGRGSYIAHNVSIITTNHSIFDPDKHVESEDVTIGSSCWIGCNSCILPGVTLGDHTTVGAGSVVTKSFPDGFCVVAGNPARIIKTIDEGMDDGSAI